MGCVTNADGEINFRVEVCSGCSLTDVEIKNSAGYVVWNACASGCTVTQISNNGWVNATGLLPGVYTITVTDCNGCDTTFTVTINSTNLAGGCMDNGAMDNTPNTGYANNQPTSATNTGWGSFLPGYAAGNYDPFAVCDDGTCIYATIGCIDPSALNYNSSAVVDDGSCYYCSFIADGDFGYATYAFSGNYNASPSATDLIQRVFQFNGGEQSMPGGSPNMMTGQVWPAAAVNLPEPWRYKHPSIGQGTPWPQTPDPTNPEWFGYYSDKYMFWWTEPTAGNSDGVDYNYYFGIPPAWNDGSLIDQANPGCPTAWIKPGIVLELKGGRDDGNGTLINLPSGGPQASNICTTTTACAGGTSSDPGRRPTNYAGIYTVVKDLTPTTCYKVEVTVTRLPVDPSAPTDPYGFDFAAQNGPGNYSNFGELRLSAGPMDNYPHWVGQGSYPNGKMLWGFNANVNYYSYASNCSNSNNSDLNWDIGPSIAQGPVTYMMEFTSNSHGEGYLGLDFRHMNFNGGWTGAGGSGPLVTSFIPLADKIMINNVCVSESRGGIDVDFACPACEGGVGAGFSQVAHCWPNNFGETSLGAGDGPFWITNCTQALASGLDNFNNTCGNCCFGCNQAGSIFYDSSATCNDGSCEPCVSGCTDNGNMSQGWWDGTVTGSYDYATQTGLATYPGGANNAISGWYVTNSPQAIGYDSSAFCDNGSCQYDDVLGCTNALANNYNQWATIDDLSCTYTAINTCLDPYACNFDAPAHNSTTGTDCVGTVGGTDYSCCTYSTVADPDSSEGTPLNPTGNLSPHIYTFKRYYLQNQTNSAMWGFGTITFDTSNNTCVIAGGSTAAGGTGLSGTYSYRHCDECPGNDLEIFATAGGGGNNAPWQSGMCDPFTMGCYNYSSTGCWQWTYLKFNYSEFNQTWYWNSDGFPSCSAPGAVWGYQIIT